MYLRDSSIIPELLRLFAAEENEELKSCLLEIIGLYDDGRTKELLRKCTGAKYSEELRFIATRAIGKLDDVSFIPLLYDISQKDDSEQIRTHAHKVLDELAVVLGFNTVDQMVLEYLQQAEKKSKE